MYPSISSQWTDIVFDLPTYVCLDGRGRASGLDRKASNATTGLQSGFSSAAANRFGITGNEEAESVRDVAVLEQQVCIRTKKKKYGRRNIQFQFRTLTTIVCYRHLQHMEKLPHTCLSPTKAR